MLSDHCDKPYSGVLHSFPHSSHKGPVHDSGMALLLIPKPLPLHALLLGFPLLLNSYRSQFLAKLPTSSIYPFFYQGMNKKGKITQILYRYQGTRDF